MKHLKLFFALFAMLALGVGNAWAETAKIDFSAQNYANQKAMTEAVNITDGITVQFAKGSGSTSPAYYTSGTSVRLYAKGTMTVSSTIGTITEITLTYGSSDKTNEITTNCGSFSSPNWTGSATEVVFTVGGTKDHRRIKAVEVTYTPSSGETPGEGGGEDPNPDPEEPGEDSDKDGLTYELVTSISDLETGAKYIVGNSASTSSIFMSTATNANNRKVTSAITITDNKVTITEDVLILELGGETGAWTFKTTNYIGTQGFLTSAASGSNNHCKVVATAESCSYFTIAFNDQEATITSTGRNERNILRYNSSSSLFACYSSGQSPVYLYKLTTSSGGDEGGSEEPVLSVTPENITWKGIAASAEKSEEITVTLSNIETVTATLSGDNPSAFSIDKNSLEASGKIVVSKNITTIGTYAAILTITDADTQTKTVTLSMEVVADPEPTGTFEKFTGTLEEGDYVLVANGTTDALKNNITSNRFDCGTVEVAEDKIVNPDKSVIWHIAANDKYWTMYNESTKKYAGGTTSKNQGALLDDVTDLAKWTITVDDQGVYTFENYGRSQQSTDANNKFLSKNSQNAYWATYASGQKNPVLYKKSDGKQPAGLVYETNKYRTKLGDSFATPTLTNPNLLVVTYSSSDNNVAEVAADGKVTTKAVGTVEITATFAGNETHREGSAAYTICVTEHAGTEVDPYSVADARRVIDVMGTAEGVYAKGLVSEIVTAYNSQYGNITYNISVDATTTADQLQAYRGKSYNGDPFGSADDIKVGDEVVVKGNLKKYNTTYEFDENNQLVSLNRSKQQAGLAYAETEHTANVGEEFTEPTLTNPNGLSITYSSSNTTLATVDANGEVTILAAGKVTITASTTGNASYTAGSASYNITITDPSLAVATLPFTYNSGKEDIETTAGITQEGLGSDYTSAGYPKLKFDGTGDNIVIRFGSQADELSYDIKGNPGQGTFSGTFAVQESEDGSTYTDLVTYTTLETTTTNKTHKLAPASRYVKFVFTEKSNGNVALGNISITKPDLRAEAGIAWNPAIVSLTAGDAFTAPTFNNPNGLSGITFASSNEELATVNNAGKITLVSGKTGTATITATFADGHADYKPAEATCVITVSPKSEKVVILAQYNGQWYALQAAYFSTYTNRLAALPVNYVGGKLYNVEEADKATIEWQLAISGTKVTFKNGENYLTGTNGTDLKLGTATFEWDYNGELFLTDGDSRTFIYHKDGFFRNYATSNAIPNSTTYSNKPLVTAPVYATGDAYGRSVNLGEDGYRYGTICLPFGSTDYTGAEFFECVGKEEGKVYIASVTTLVAGTPYIFLASATEVAVYGDGTTAATAGNSNGLYGTFTDGTVVAANDDNHILLNNELRKVAETCWVNANRAYLVMSEVPTEYTKMPGRRYIGMSTQGENEATGFDNIQLPNANSQKLIINGQLIIIRDGEMYNAQGQKL